MDHAPDEPVSFAGGVLDPFRHVCAFVNGREEFERILDPFIRQGLEGGDRLLQIVDPTDPDGPLGHVRDLGFDVHELLRDDRYEVRTWSDTYLRGGRFDPDAMNEMLEEILLAPTGPRVRMVADMGWAAGRPEAPERLLEFEARANFVHARHRHVVICAYEAGRFDGGFVMDVLRTHPIVLVGGILQVNPFFVPAAEFLEELRERAAS